MKNQQKIILAGAIAGAALVGIFWCRVAWMLFWEPTAVSLWSLQIGSAVSGGVLLTVVGYLLYNFRSFVVRHDTNSDFFRHQEYLEQRCQTLTKKLEDMSALHCLDSAAMCSQDLNGFMDGLVRLAHENAGAKEFAFYLGNDKQLGPKAYYQLDKNIEFCLTFTPRGSQHIARDLWEIGQLPNRRLCARGMSIRREEESLILEGELLYDADPVGKMRLSLPLMPDNTFSREELRKIVSFELSRVQICGRLVREALDTGSRFSEDNGDGLLSVTMAVCDHQKNRIGVMCVKFANPAGPDAIDREKFLISAGRHFAKAAQNENLYQQAICDGLTGLYNKRHLLDELSSLVTNAQKHNAKLSLVILDIDHFKKVNDKHGHQMGDLILKSVAEILQESVRACDLACRYGGEELVLLLPDCQMEGAVTLAERIRVAVAGKSYTAANGKQFKVTASFGVAEYSPAIGGAAELISTADCALYEAKHNGRNQVCRALANKAA